MSQNEKKAYYYAIRDRYKKAAKQEKTIILQEFCSVCGYNRKYAIRILNNAKKNKWQKRSVGRKPKYTSKEFTTAVKNIWIATDYICSKRLKAAIPLWLPYYESTYGPMSDEIKLKFESISPATIDRLLKPVRIYSKRGLTGTKPGSLLKNQIPIRMVKSRN